jgi:hypothetical protein
MTRGVGDLHVVLLFSVARLEVFVEHRTLLADGDRYVLGLHPLLVRRMGIARSDDRLAGGVGEAGDSQVDRAQIVEIVGLQLEVPVVADKAVEHVAVLLYSRVIKPQDRLGHVTRDTRRRDQDVLVVLLEQLVVDAGLLVEAGSEGFA